MNPDSTLFMLEGITDFKWRVFKAEGLNNEVAEVTAVCIAFREESDERFYVLTPESAKKMAEHLQEITS